MIDQPPLLLNLFSKIFKISINYIAKNMPVPLKLASFFSNP
jgi:hypothetical protein